MENSHRISGAQGAERHDGDGGGTTPNGIKRASNEIALLAARAARGVGFEPEQSGLFGRAAVRHLAAGGDVQALQDALRSTTDSPILRLPLLIEDIKRAVPFIGPEVSLTLLSQDTPLAPAYCGLLPMKLEGTRIVNREGALPQIIVLLDLDAATPSLPPREVSVPETLIHRWSRMAGPFTDNPRGEPRVARNA